MRFCSLLYISASFLVNWGCNSNNNGKRPDITADSALSEVVSSSQSSPSQSAIENISDAGAGPDLHFEGSARPPGIIFKEPVLPKPTSSIPGPNRTVEIKGGTFRAGSPVQDILRVNFAEMDLVPIEIKPFEIDALPYPNDPGKTFLTNVSRDEAERLCAMNGKRLCTELEWEAACKSGDDRRYPSGNIYSDNDYPEDDLIMPASLFGVFAMGRILEWTALSWGPEADQVERGTVKGYYDGFELSRVRGRRCAARWRRTPTAGNSSIGFRCCKGEMNTIPYVIEPPRPPFSLYNNIKPEKFAEIIRSIPELGAVHDNPHMFSDADIRTVMARRENDRESLAEKGIHFRWKPVRWIPRQGMELWVAVGRSNKHSFIVALHEVEDNEKYTHASSLVLYEQPTALAIGYREGHRDELYWAPCWNCRDGGTVAFDDEKNEVIITHRW